MVMRVLVHDYAGHPFQVQLARALAGRGHMVRHLFSSTNLTPQGPLARRPDDPDGFTPVGIAQSRPVAKGAVGGWRSVGALAARRRSEAEHGRRVAADIAAFRPDVVLSANAPLDAEALILRATHAAGAGFVKWLQDVVSVATARLLSDRLPGLGHAVGAYYTAVERRQLRAADAVVVITDDFQPLLTRWGVRPEAVTTVENWAPLGEVGLGRQSNPWSRAHGLDGRPVVLYAGTLGMKHDPELLATLAARVAAEGPPGARVVVVSEGAGAEFLVAAKAARGLEALDVLPFQPFEAMADVLASATVLAAVLEPEAGAFSVPSKVLTYLCAGRPVLLSVPPENLAARLVAREGAGRVVAPGSPEAFAEAALSLLADPAVAAAAGARARAYAERAFAIEAIADRFEAILGRAARSWR